MRKYRIKIKEMADGSKIYYAQYKVLCFWRYLTEAYIGYDIIYTPRKFTSIEEAKKAIEGDKAEILSEKVKINII